jgi:hypothetical protein
MIETKAIEHIITEQRDTMLPELVDMIVNEDTASTVITVADSVLTTSLNDSVSLGMRSAIQGDSCFTGVLYSIKFNNFKFTVVVEVKNDVCNIYYIEKLAFKAGEHFDPNDHAECKTEYWKGYGKEELIADIDTDLEEFTSFFRMEIEKELSLAIMKTKFLNFYGRGINEVKIGVGQRQSLFSQEGV